MKEKRDRLVDAMSLADDRYVWEARPDKKKRTAWARLGLIAACMLVAVTSLNLWLFLPFSTKAPDVSRFDDSEYYDVIQKLNEITYTKPHDKNNFEKFFGGLFSVVGGMVGGDSMNGADNEGAPGDGSTGTGYVEVTDNQVQGVIEGDLFKRSETHLFYLYGNVLRAYTIDKENSTLAGEFIIGYTEVNEKGEEGNILHTYSPREMYLSKDGRTVTALAHDYGKKEGTQLLAISIDVSDPANMSIQRIVRITGEYSSARVVDGKLLLMSTFYVGRDPDFSDEMAFLPQIDTGEGWQSVPVDDIILPETLTSPRYTVVTMLDENTLDPLGFSAFLSWGNTFYVSPTTIYAGRGETVTKEVGLKTESHTETEIFALDYSGEGFVHRGSVRVDGSLKDQYSMDEYKGLLRVVTTTNHRTVSVFDDGMGNSSATTGDSEGTNASLFCIDLESMEIVACLEKFAPFGETVESVRFDGDTAYVCTAVVVTLSDPVFFIDMSDLNNITAKDTGTIEGYSTSLINFGDGFLLGIGRGDRWDTVKIEVYEESENGVVSVCSKVWEGAEYSTDYKSYFIDRERGLLGFGIYDFNLDGENRFQYVLLHFDHYSLHTLKQFTLENNYHGVRAALIDGYLYVLNDSNMIVENIGME